MSYGIRAHMMDHVRYPGPGECSDAPCRMQSGGGHPVQYDSQSVRHVLGTRVNVRSPEFHVDPMRGLRCRTVSGITCGIQNGPADSARGL